MPKIPRDGLLWGVRKVMETTSMSRVSVEFLMSRGFIPSFVYRGEVVTTEKQVELFLERCIHGDYGTISNGAVAIIEPISSLNTKAESHKGSFDADELRNEINSVRQSLGLPPLYRSSRKRRPKQSINEPDVNIGSDDTRSIRMDL